METSKKSNSMPNSRKAQRKPTSWWQRNRLLWIPAAAVLIIVTTIAFSHGGGGNSPQALPVSSSDKSKGEANAPVTVVEYSDFQCPYCGVFATNAERQLEEEFVGTGKVRFVYRNLAFIGNESQWAAQAAECANEQGKFWDYHDKLFNSQKGENDGAFSKPNLKGFAVELGLDTAQFNQCLDSGKYATKVRQETLEGQQAGVRGTPTLFVNGQLIDQGANYDVLRASILAILGE